MFVIINIEDKQEEVNLGNSANDREQEMSPSSPLQQSRRHRTGSQSWREGRMTNVLLNKQLGGPVDRSAQVRTCRCMSHLQHRKKLQETFTAEEKQEDPWFRQKTVIQSLIKGYPLFVETVLIKNFLRGEVLIQQKPDSRERERPINDAAEA